MNIITQTEQNIQFALKYAAIGWRVLPLNGKIPLIKGWTEKATTDTETITKWWEEYPKANIGIATGGGSGVIVLDVDVKHGGIDSLKKLINEHGELPQTVTAKTGSGGYHYFFKAPEWWVKNGVQTLGSGLDIRGDGGQVVVYPSIHPGTKKPYQWVYGCSPFDIEPADLPGWLAELLQQNNKRAVEKAKEQYKGRVWWSYVKGAVIPDGVRNETLFRKVASSMRGKGASYEDILETLIVINETRVKPPVDLEELEKIAYSANRYPEGKQLGSQSLLDYPDSDIGNAERLIARHGADLKYCVEMESWLVWDGTRWAKDDHYEVYRRAMETIRSFRLEAEEELAKAEIEMDKLDKNSATPNELKALHQKVEAAKKRVQFARTSEFRSRIEAMVQMAKTLPGVPISVNELDQDKYLINLQNGTYDLKTDTFREHRREDLITKIANVAYEPTAKAERWERFLLEVMAGDKEMVDYLQRVCGVCLSGDTSEEYMYIPYGTGGNGKSKFLGALLHVLGDYGMQASSNLLLSNRQNPGQANPELVRIRGARLVVTTESGDGKKLDEELVKLLTGNDWITTRDLYQKTISFRPEAKFFLATNHKPLIYGTDNGIWRRVLLIPFEVTFTGEKKDKNLEEKLQAEANGIFLWMLEGFRKWKERGVQPPEKVVMATAEYREEMDRLGSFLEECCVIHPNARCGITPLYNEYKKWAEEVGERTMSRNLFTKRLKERGFEQGRSGTLGRFWIGVGLTYDYPRLANAAREEVNQARQEAAATVEENTNGWVEGVL